MWLESLLKSEGFYQLFRRLSVTGLVLARVINAGGRVCKARLETENALHGVSQKGISKP